MNRPFRVSPSRPLLDIVSYGRGGPGRTDRLSLAQIGHISRTVRRAPEVMVKISGGGKSLKAVQAHVGYIGRRGRLDIETDDGDQPMRGREAAMDLTEDWGLETEAAESKSLYVGIPGRKPKKLVHNIVLSMPKGTSPAGVLTASRAFAREQFALKHRYAMVLHTDQPHPHVHLVVKAMSEDGERLNIRKATLRDWRQEFARHLREQGIEANATERAVRGETKKHKPDRIYRLERDGRSAHFRDHHDATPGELKKKRVAAEAAKSKMLQTRIQVERGWQAVSDRLFSEGHSALAADVIRFAGSISRLQTDQERIGQPLLDRAHKPRARERERDQQLTR
jgi:hypothetical protein